MTNRVDEYLDEHLQYVREWIDSTFDPTKYDFDEDIIKTWIEENITLRRQVENVYRVNYGDDAKIQPHKNIESSKLNDYYYKCDMCDDFLYNTYTHEKGYIKDDFGYDDSVRRHAVFHLANVGISHKNISDYLIGFDKYKQLFVLEHLDDYLSYCKNHPDEEFKSLFEYYDKISLT